MGSSVRSTTCPVKRLKATCRFAWSAPSAVPGRRAATRVPNPAHHRLLMVRRAQSTPPWALWVAAPGAAFMRYGPDLGRPDLAAPASRWLAAAEDGPRLTLGLAAG